MTYNIPFSCEKKNFGYIQKLTLNVFIFFSESF